MKEQTNKSLVKENNVNKKSLSPMRELVTIKTLKKKVEKRAYGSTAKDMKKSLKEKCLTPNY